MGYLPRLSNIVPDHPKPWLIQLSRGASGGRRDLSAAFIFSHSRHFRRPAPLAVQILRPAAATVGEVIAMGDQPLMQMAGQLRDADGARMVPEEVAGHADLSLIHI